MDSEVLSLQEMAVSNISWNIQSYISSSLNISDFELLPSSLRRDIFSRALAIGTLKAQQFHLALSSDAREVIFSEYGTTLQDWAVRLLVPSTLPEDEDEEQDQHQAEERLRHVVATSTHAIAKGKIGPRIQVVGCPHLRTLSLSGCDKILPRTIEDVVSFCGSLSSLDVSHFSNTVEVLRLVSSSLSSLNISNSRSAVDFRKCPKLTTINARNYGGRLCARTLGVFWVSVAACRLLERVDIGCSKLLVHYSSGQCFCFDDPLSHFRTLFGLPVSSLGVSRCALNWETVFSALKLIPSGSSRLKELDLSDNQLLGRSDNLNEVLTLMKDKGIELLVLSYHHVTDSDSFNLQGGPNQPSVLFV